jgi:hypothetical protein
MEVAMAHRWKVRVGLAVLILAVTAAPATAAGAQGDRFVAVLAARNEVPANDSQGHGVATFKLSRDGTALDFKLNVANIQDVTQAHIHCGGPDVNGPVVAFLYGLNPAGVTQNGRLSEGTITEANVIPRPDSAACPGGIATFDDMIEAMQTGGAYVNVHTIALPPGEIRGHLSCNIPAA